jgi:hypothetical protein
LSPQVPIEQSSPLKSEQNVPCTGLGSQSRAVVKPASGSITREQVEPLSGETCVTEGSPAESSVAFTDIQDYEIVNLKDVYPSEGAVINNMGIEKCANGSGSRGHWWTLIWKH